jgi:hypothetical protein
MDIERSPLGHGPRPRRRRVATRVIQRLFGFSEPAVDERGLVDELHRWALGLPFVEELEPVPSAPDLRRFAINCPPLNCSAVWLLTGRFELELPERDFNVYAVLPQSVAEALVGVGGRLGPDLPDDRRLVAMGTPARPGELFGLEDVLLTAHSLAFHDS